MLPPLLVLLPIISTILLSAILVVVGMVARRWAVAIAGFVLLALTGLLVLYIGLLLEAV